VQVARQAGYVGAELYNATLATSLLSILVNALLVRWASTWVGRLRLARQPSPLAGAVGDGLRDHVVLCGFGRVGSAVGEALETFRLPYVVVETDPDIVKNLGTRRVPSLFGDAAQRRLLEAAGVARARLVVVTIPERERARLAVNHARALNPSVPILARAHDREATEALRAAGATEVIQPELEAGLTLIRHGLGQLALPKQSLVDYLEVLREAIGGVPERARAARQGLPEARDLVLAADGVADQSLREARLPERFGVTVVRIDRPDGETVLSPDADTVLRPGDRIRVFGLRHQIEAFLTEAAPPR
jgi:CPA2 family monovalent cation:H+ antiporter-2